MARAGRGRLHAKKKSFTASQQERPDVQAKRREWQERLKNIDPKRLIFVDESGIQTHMKRLYGRADSSLRVVDHAPAGRQETRTIVAAINLAGVVTAMVTPEAVNGVTFLGFVQQFLAPRLKRGDIAVMDNLKVHKVAGVREAIEATGAELWYQPPYSPDLNPIEMAWSKVKAWLRRHSPPTFRRLVNCVGQALSRITPQDCLGFFSHCDYCGTSY
ncbi:MAG: IS630 family transposase [Lacipirellulaceae bacterium]